MFTWARPGARCVCIARSFRCIDAPHEPDIGPGEVLTIRAAELDDQVAGGVILSFKGRHPDKWYGITAFRPVVRPEADLALFAPMLRPVQMPELA